MLFSAASRSRRRLAFSFLRVTISALSAAFLTGSGFGGSGLGGSGFGGTGSGFGGDGFGRRLRRSASAAQGVGRARSQAFESLLVAVVVVSHRKAKGSRSSASTRDDMVAAWSFVNAVPVVAQQRRRALANLLAFSHRQQGPAFPAPPRHDVGRARVRTAAKALTVGVLSTVSFATWATISAICIAADRSCRIVEYRVAVEFLRDDPVAKFVVRPAGAATKQLIAVARGGDDSLVAANLFLGEAAVVVAHRLAGALPIRIWRPVVTGSAMLVVAHLSRFFKAAMQPRGAHPARLAPPFCEQRSIPAGRP